MAMMKLTLPGKANVSLQAKPRNIPAQTDNIDSGAWDIIYFTRIDPVTNKQYGDIYRLGTCTSIIQGVNEYVITIHVDSTAQTPDPNDFIFFGKENKVNISGVRGYYAELEMRNDSSSQAKLFTVGSEIAESSK